MKESDYNHKQVQRLLTACPHAVYYKHADKFTRGIPDSTLTWAGPTSWLEFKLLDPVESIHAQLDPVQLVELIKLEQQCQRAWVIAFRRPRRSPMRDERLVIYRPTFLFGERVPRALEYSSAETVLRDLRLHGVASFGEIDYDVVVRLVHETHKIHSPLYSGGSR